MSEKTVFLSYSHDSDAYSQQVLALSERLRADGIETRLDQYVNGSPPEGWARWTLDQLDAADVVLVICSETYYRRFRGHEQPGLGRGADWEGALITQEMYDSRSRTSKFMPVFMAAAVKDWIPEPLRAVSYYALTSEPAYQSLYDAMLGQAGVQPRPVGAIKPKVRRQGAALAFDTAAPAAIVKVDVSRPRVYLGYTLRTAGLRDKVFELAENLREQGIDSRMDLYYAKSLHGFIPPDPVPNRDSWEAWQEAEIRDADRVLVVCSQEFGESPKGSGAWRDVAFMKKNLKSAGVQRRKFIPVGFGSYEVNAAFVPAFIRGATYYDLTPGTTTGFGFDDLVRRFRTEFPRNQEPVTAGNPGDQATDVYNRGLRWLAEGRYDRALDALDRAIALDPTLALAYYNRGLTHYFENDMDLAIVDFDRAQAVGFAEAILFRNRGNAFSRKGNVARALADYGQAIALEPGNPLAYLNRGEVHENTLRKELAIADYRTVLGLVCEPEWHDKARQRLLAMGVRLAAPQSSPALDIWKEKLTFLQIEEAKAADIEQKFAIQQRIKEALAKVKELES